MSEQEADLLKKAYAAANEDSDRESTISEWSVLELEDWIRRQSASR